jgi:WD40 repeat protein
VSKHVNTYLLAAFLAVSGVSFGGDKPPSETKRGSEPASKEPRCDSLGDSLPDGAIMRIGTVRLRHPGCFPSAALSSDGKTIVSAGNGLLCFWDSTTGKQTNEVELSFKTSVNQMVYSPNGKMLAIAGQKGTVYLYEVETGKEIRQLAGPRNHVAFSVAFSPDSKSIASGGMWSAPLRVWDVTTGDEVVQFEKQRMTVLSIAYSRDGKNIIAATGGNAPTVRAFDAVSGKELWKEPGPKQDTCSVAYSRDGKVVAAAGDNGAIQLYESETGEKLDSLGKAAFALAFSPKEDILASGGHDGVIYLYDPASGKELRKLQGHGARVTSLAFSESGKALLSASQDGSIRLWDVASGKEFHLFPWHQHDVLSVAYSTNGKNLFSNSSDHTARAWDAVTGKELRLFDQRPFLPENDTFVWGANKLGDPADPLVLSSDPEIVGVRCRDLRFHFWDTKTGKELSHFTFQEQTDKLATTSAMFLPGDKTILTGDSTGVAYFWNTSTGEVIDKLDFSKETTAKPPAIFHFGLAHEAGLVGSCRKGTVYLWDPVTKKQVVRYHFKHPSFRPLAISPDGRTLVKKGDGFGLLSLDDSPEGEPLQQRKLNVPRVNGVAFSPDGKLLATTDETNTLIQLWEVATGQEVCQLKGHRAAVCSVGFSPDGRKLVSGSRDATMLVWDLGLAFKEKAAQLSVPPTSKELDKLWEDLESIDTHKAFSAVSTLTSYPEAAVSLLKDHMKPAPDRHRRVLQLLTDLGDVDFDVREKATGELRELGRDVVPAIRDALKDPASAEARRRLDELLEGFRQRNREQNPKVLRQSRAIFILERLEIKSARESLRDLAEGGTDSDQTREAQSALRRLQHLDQKR